MRKTTLTLFILLLSTGFALSQNAENKWGFGLHFGVMEYNGDYGNEYMTFEQGYAGALSIARYLNPSFDVMLHGFYDRVRKVDENNLMPGTQLSFMSHMYNVNLLAKYKFNNGYIFKEESRIAPFVLGGLGANYADGNGTGENGAFTQTLLRPNLYGGVGVGIRLTSWLSFAVQTSLEYPLTDVIDGTKGDVVTAPNSLNDIFHQNSVSLYFTPGKAKDSDGDGVIDKNDMCPDTPPGVAVDENGCPLDTDKDGIYDYEDECPTIPGLKEFNGCPDTDGDGIQDKEDECPDEPGPAVLKGCPDSDGDGVPDKDDRCPDTPKGWQVDRFGCPIDSDRDGIPDSEDECPEEPGVAELKGCPFDVPTLMAKYSINNQKILFDFDDSNLQDNGMQTLNKIAEALSNQQNFGVHLDGHTDWTGSNDYNLKLSEKRVASAKRDLIGKGIQDGRIGTEYFGEANPFMDNITKEGRKFNRRVDYKLFKIK